MSDIDRRAQGFTTFLQLERTARHAETPAALSYTIVNETRRLLTYQQAMLIDLRGSRPATIAVSGVAAFDANAPFIRWLHRIAASVVAGEKSARLHALDAGALDPAEREAWAEWSPPQALWCPFLAAPGAAQARPFAVLWLAREQPWQDGEKLLAEQLADAYAHAMAALSGRRRRIGRPWRWLIGLASAAAVALALAIPVSQSALGPAEVVARDPAIVAAPMDGVVQGFAVQPNQQVAAGDLLFRFDDTDLRSRRDVAERALGVARAELRQATQGAFTDRRSSAQLASLEAQVNLRQAELDYARERLERVQVTAPRAGIAVFADAKDWIGRPVTTGERILQVADPAQVELKVSLAVKDGIVLREGAAIELFLDIDPVRPLPARLLRASYEAELTPLGVLAYRIAAEFDAATPPPRIGLQGTAKLYGETVPLALYIFRRPLSALRQSVGF